MKSLSARTHIALGSTLLLTSLLLAAFALGLVPDRRGAIRDGRTHLAETIAVASSTFLTEADLGALESLLRGVKDRNPELLSLAVRRKDRVPMLTLGAHERLWDDTQTSVSTGAQLLVPIWSAGRHWGQVELRFEPLAAPGWLGVARSPEMRLLVFMAFASFLRLLRSTCARCCDTWIRRRRCRPMCARHSTRSPRGCSSSTARSRSCSRTRPSPRSSGSLAGGSCSGGVLPRSTGSQPDAAAATRFVPLEPCARRRPVAMRNDMLQFRDRQRRTAHLPRQLLARARQRRQLRRRADQPRRRHPARGSQGTALRGQGRGGGGQSSQERVPRQHEPRDPHADERDPRLHRGAAARLRQERGGSRAAPRHDPLERRAPAPADQRRPRPLEGRVGASRTRADPLRASRPDPGSDQRARRSRRGRRASRCASSRKVRCPRRFDPIRHACGRSSPISSPTRSSSPSEAA